MDRLIVNSAIRLSARSYLCSLGRSLSFLVCSEEKEEVPSCFNAYGCHATEKDFFFLHLSDRKRKWTITVQIIIEVKYI